MLSKNVARLLRIAVIGVIVIAGLWLAARSVAPGRESAAREQALQLAAPGRPATGRANGAPLPERVVASPAAVDLRAIPPGVYDPNNQLDRWKRGEIDIKENEGIVSEARMASLRADSMRLRPSGNITVAGSGPARSAPSSAGASFDSISYPECCGGGGNVPPDPELAVGPNHAIAVVNVAFEIYDKSGQTLVAPTTFASLFAANPNCSGVFDPNAVYDEEADRFVLGIDADGLYYCVAVSQTGNPTAGWNIYAFPTASGSDFFDYPHAGVGRDAIYMGANIFGTSSFKESRIWAFDKWAMYSGQPAASASKPLPTTEDTPQPLNLHGWAQGTWPASGPHYFFTETNYNGATYSVWSWASPFSGTSPAKVGTVNLQTFTGVTAGMPVAVPYLGATGRNRIDGGDFRPQDFEYRNGYAWSVGTIACNPGGGTVNCVRWAKINPATASIVDAGVYASNGEFRTYGDLAVNHCDDMAVGYTKSSTAIYPAIYYTGRKASDLAGTLQAEALLKAGEIAYTSFESAGTRRWGDYTEMTIAPDGVTFWYIGEYAKNTGTTSGRWGTWIGSFSYADCTTGGGNPTPTPAPTSTPTATPQAIVMRVTDLDGSKRLTSSNRWEATVTITVRDGAGNPVSGAAVTGAWSAGATGSGSCTTAAAGTCSVVKGNIRTGTTSVRYTVNNVTKTGATYNATLNSDPDGDSDGTQITVTRP